jgi:ferritin-like metal-binding protein YciE
MASARATAEAEDMLELEGRSASALERVAEWNSHRSASRTIALYEPLRRFAMELENLRALYIDELKDLYSAEKQLVKALPKMAKNASSPELRKAFEDHLAETEGHVERLEEIFETLESSPRGKKCVGMEGLIEEAKELLEEDAQEDVLDAGLISKAQHVEHYEMAGYGTVRTYAMILGEEKHARLLQQTLDEEKKADQLLTRLAEASINIEAAVAEEDEESTSDREVPRQVASDRQPRRTSAPPAKKTRSSSRSASAR